MSILLRKGEEKMKKKILFLVAAFALFVPSVLAAEPTLEDKNFFAMVVVLVLYLELLVIHGMRELTRHKLQQ